MQVIIPDLTRVLRPFIAVGNWFCNVKRSLCCVKVKDCARIGLKLVVLRLRSENLASVDHCCQNLNMKPRANKFNFRLIQF